MVPDVSKNPSATPSLCSSNSRCFAALVPAILLGAAAERSRLLPAMLFIFCWTTLCYDPLAHWVWSANGWAAKWGVLDCELTVLPVSHHELNDLSRCWRWTNRNCFWSWRSRILLLHRQAKRMGYRESRFQAIQRQVGDPLKLRLSSLTRALQSSRSWYRFPVGRLDGLQRRIVFCRLPESRHGHLQH